MVWWGSPLPVACTMQSTRWEGPTSPVGSFRYIQDSGVRGGVREMEKHRPSVSHSHLKCFTIGYICALCESIVLVQLSHLVLQANLAYLALTAVSEPCMVQTRPRCYPVYLVCKMYIPCTGRRTFGAVCGLRSHARLWDSQVPVPRLQWMCHTTTQGLCPISWVLLFHLSIIIIYYYTTISEAQVGIRDVWTFALFCRCWKCPRSPSQQDLSTFSKRPFLCGPTNRRPTPGEWQAWSTTPGGRGRSRKRRSTFLRQSTGSLTRTQSMRPYSGGCGLALWIPRWCDLFLSSSSSVIGCRVRDGFFLKSATVREQGV